MENNLTIEDAAIGDLNKIVSIYNSTIPSRMVTADTTLITSESRIPWFNEHTPHSRPLWVVKIEDQVVAWISFQSFYGRPAYRHTAEISIYIEDAHRGKGIGRQLLAYSISRCEQLRIYTLLGFIFAHNEPSIRLFTSLGFSEWAHLPEVAEIEQKKMSLKIFGKKIT